MFYDIKNRKEKTAFDNNVVFFPREKSTIINFHILEHQFFFLVTKQIFLLVFTRDFIGLQYLNLSSFAYVT